MYVVVKRNFKICHRYSAIGNLFFSKQAISTFKGYLFFSKGECIGKASHFLTRYSWLPSLERKKLDGRSSAEKFPQLSTSHTRQNWLPLAWLWATTATISSMASPASLRQLGYSVMLIHLWYFQHMRC